MRKEKTSKIKASPDYQACKTFLASSKGVVAVVVISYLQIIITITNRNHRQCKFVHKILKNEEKEIYKIKASSNYQACKTF